MYHQNLPLTLRDNLMYSEVLFSEEISYGYSQKGIANIDYFVGKKIRSWKLALSNGVIVFYSSFVVFAKNKEKAFTFGACLLVKGNF